MTTAIVHYLSDTLIERRRLLLGPARILVRRGQKITTFDPVVEDLFGSQHLLLNAARGLGVSPSRADKLISGKVGVCVSPGDILAGPVGLARRTVRSPSSGKIVNCEHGQILLELEGSSNKILAGMPGEVVDLIPDRGVVIRAYGSLIQGVWGNGKIGQGHLRVMLEESDQGLTGDQVKENMAGSLLVGSYCEDVRVFEIASQVQLNGIILGSLQPSLIIPALNSPVPIMIVDGFGKHPLNPVASQILAACEGMIGALNAETVVRLSVSRPELVVSKDPINSSEPSKTFDFLSPGKKVRFIGTSMLGITAYLVDLIGETTLQNGLNTTAATLQLADGEIITAPLGNLELLD